MRERRGAFKQSASQRIFIFAAMLSCSSLVSCIADPTFASGPEREELLQAFREYASAEDERRLRDPTSSSKTFVVHPGPTLEETTLSVDLQGVTIRSVINEILESASASYRANVSDLYGRVSARFTKVPLVEALNILLADTGFVARLDDGLLRISKPIDGSLSGTSSDGQDMRIISREITLNDLDAADAVTLIQDLYSWESDSDVQPLTAGKIAELNTVYLTGPAYLVTDAMNVLSRADRPVPHVVISALVVDIDASSVERLGATLSDGADGNFSLSSLIPNTTTGNIVATFDELVSNSAQLTATINFLAAQNIAHVLSRPYIATRSTKPAAIEIVDDQFARVNVTSDDSSIVTTDSITAGISMSITPIVMADRSIRVDISIEDSRFTVTAGDIVIAKERNTASTSMIVKSGQTIVIGGLNSRYRITERSGTPWLRKIPLLNVLAGDQESLETQAELVVYLTPHIWTPGLEAPLPQHDALELSTPSLLSVETLGRD